MSHYDDDRYDEGDDNRSLARYDRRHHMPVASQRRGGGSFASRQAQQLPNGYQQQNEMRLTGVRRVHQPRRIIVEEYGFFGGLKRRTVFEECFTADFADDLDEMFDE